jgi:hypothetical protein
MKRFLSVLMVMAVLAWTCPIPAFAEDIPGLATPETAVVKTVETVTTTTVAPAADPTLVVVSQVLTLSLLDRIVAYVNSSAGLTVISAILVFILGKIFTAKPAWKLVYDKYLPLLMQGVKHAEKAIPDGYAPNKAFLRADAALKFVIQLEPALAKVSAAVLSQAITMAHAAAETNENI